MIKSGITRTPCDFAFLYFIHENDRDGSVLFVRFLLRKKSNFYRFIRILTIQLSVKVVLYFTLH